ncbi:ArsR/SmtB family transcription factor [Spirochaeta isovalerica]|uniref:DNA-binding transcriptional ArsR family regulator n=1 Tax=Spirochaeta isovalerica TaxID=150 RepID=A0A841R9Z0_9SPIO|nr:metalloregulator ArsR/SmtB family transcription factor [Spirochaeta isovalerica]MBB6480067.1 DNA-binding transcriptional ArsR family regulator [Spirochaeta isovalerica]
MPSDNIISVQAGPGLELNPVLNTLNSMIVLSNKKHCPHCQNHLNLTDEESETARLVFEGLYHAVIPQHTFSSFPAYLDYLKGCDPLELRDNILTFYKQRHDWKTGSLKEQTSEEISRKVLVSPDGFISFLQESFDPDHIDQEIERQAFEYLKHPDKMRKVIISFLSGLWNRTFQQRWEEVKDDLTDFIGKTELSYLKNMSPLKAIYNMTGSEIHEEKIAFALEKGYRLIFIPNKDVGEIYSKMLSQGVLYIFFNPENYEKRRLNAQLNNIDELARKLGAIADPNRLNILKYIASKNEACSQDIIRDMGFSQSAVSRHLKTLSDSGILMERRQVSAKFYRLNGEYVHNILHSLTGFLGI